MLDQAAGVIRSLADHTLEQQLLVSGLHLRKVALDTVELRAVRHVEDLGDVQALKQQLLLVSDDRANKLMNTQRSSLITF